MARKKKNRKNKLEETTLDDKRAKLAELLDYLHTTAENYIADQEKQCESKCERIRYVYAKLSKSMDKKYLNMTVDEYLKEQAEEQEKQNNTPFSPLERVIAESSKKKTGLIDKKASTNHKRSMTLPSHRPVLLSQQTTTPLLRKNRILSESLNCTPASKLLTAPRGLITPKFNPRTKLPKTALRKARAGEIVMSLSGSPLINPQDEENENPGKKEGRITLEFGKGRVISISEDVELEDSFVNGLDDDAKTFLKNVHTKLEKIVSEK